MTSGRHWRRSRSAEHRVYAVVASNLVAKLESDWNSVAIFGLIVRIESSNATQHVRRQQCTDDFYSGELMPCGTTGLVSEGDFTSHRPSRSEASKHRGR